MSRPQLPEDPGLAIERTLMAWGRTALGLLGLAALLVRFGESEHVEAVAFPVAAFAVCVSGLSYWRAHRAYHHEGLPFLSHGELRAFAIATTVIVIGTTGTAIAGLV